MSALQSGFAQDSGGSTTQAYRIPLTIAPSAPETAPIAVTIDFRELLDSDTAVVDRNSIRVMAGDLAIPCSVSGDLETIGAGTIAWRSTDAKLQPSWSLTCGRISAQNRTARSITLVR